MPGTHAELSGLKHGKIFIIQVIPVFSKLPKGEAVSNPLQLIVRAIY